VGSATEQLERIVAPECLTGLQGRVSLPTTGPLRLRVARISSRTEMLVLLLPAALLGVLAMLSR
jgi:hypothetical protein